MTDAPHEVAGAGFGPVVSIVRMRFVHFWDVPLALWRFSRLRASTSGSVGLLRTTVTIADPWTLLSISVWRDRRSMLHWSGRRVAHVSAVRWTYGRTREVWAGVSQLQAVRRNSNTWDGQRMALVERSPTPWRPSEDHYTAIDEAALDPSVEPH